MSHFLIIILTLISPTNVMSQNQSFDNAVRSLYFNVDIFNASGSVVDTFKNLEVLKYNDTVINQWNLGASIFMNAKENAWSSRHVFSFTRSPLDQLKIRSGQISITLGETSNTKKFVGVDWQVDFDNKNDGELFYNTLKKIFSPLSTIQKTKYDKPLGYIAQYSTRNENEKGINDISFCFGKSPLTNKYQITLFLFNEFARKK